MMILVLTHNNRDYDFCHDRAIRLIVCLVKPVLYKCSCIKCNEHSFPLYVEVENVVPVEAKL